MEKNCVLTEELGNLKREQEAQSILLFETTKLKKKVEEDRAMIEEDKRVLVIKLKRKHQM